MFKSSNVGSTDRIARIIIGALLIAAPYFTSWGMWSNGTLRLVVPVIGLVLVLTALVRFCPLYRILGVNTCKTK